MYVTEFIVWCADVNTTYSNYYVKYMLLFIQCITLKHSTHSHSEFVNNQRQGFWRQLLDAKRVLVRLHPTPGGGVIPPRRYLMPRESARVVVVRVRGRVGVRVRVRVTHLSLFAAEGLHCNEFCSGISMKNLRFVIIHGN